MQMGIQQKHAIRVAEGQENDEGNLVGEVRFATDYLTPWLHESSLLSLPGIWWGVTPFDNWGAGADVLTATWKDDVQDGIRKHMEAADFCQGLTLVGASQGAFAALTSGVLQEIREAGWDQLPMLSLLLEGGTDPDPRGQSHWGEGYGGYPGAKDELPVWLERSLAYARHLECVGDDCLVLPWDVSRGEQSARGYGLYQFPSPGSHLSQGGFLSPSSATVAYYESALPAVAWDTVTTPLRMVPGRSAEGEASARGLSMRELVETGKGRLGRVAETWVEIPHTRPLGGRDVGRNMSSDARDPRGVRKEAEEADGYYTSSPLVCWTPRVDERRIRSHSTNSNLRRGKTGVGELVVVRGAREAGTGRSLSLAEATAVGHDTRRMRPRRPHGLHVNAGNTHADATRDMEDESGGVRVRQVCVCDARVALPRTMPRIFTSLVTPGGDVRVRVGGGGRGGRLSSLGVLTRIRSDRRVGLFLDELRHKLDKSRKVRQLIVDKV